MKKNNRDEKQLSVRGKEPSLLLILQEVVNRGITADNLAVVEKMIALHEIAQDRDAEKQFAIAFNALMCEMGEINATEPVEDKNGVVMYRWAPLYKIDKQLRPLALKHGFTYYWAESSVQQEGKVTENCIVQHIGGHKRSTPFTVRDSAPPHANNSQGSMSTHGYAKRGSLVNAFGIVIDKAVIEDDARMEHGPVTFEQASELRQRVREMDIDQDAFLTYAGVTVPKGEQVAYDELFLKIPSDRYDRLNELLDRKAHGKKPQTQDSLL